MNTNQMVKKIQNLHRDLKRAANRKQAAVDAVTMAQARLTRATTDHQNAEMAIETAYREFRSALTAEAKE